ncbi:unnamed protein product [Prorocentrum cordatum]|uniref:Uncharacterized protein n=1 Tax=Prorocentrum cordatum TaxID=2364126 RepID=A0ABN9SJI9_9DINO|nr:unnamed protein product [Polarella glacialis]|mmetsp:Transcript_29904/g.79528  ORF Transcript_29904/g.79528 Transcript_29904/m.79528 type:complete len:118 (-) Transcript_29904:376-729(-)
MAVSSSILLLLFGLFLLGGTTEDRGSLKADIKRLKTQLADNAREMRDLLQKNQDLVKSMNPYQESPEVQKQKLQDAAEVSQKQSSALRQEADLQQRLREKKALLKKLANREQEKAEL